MELGGNIVLTGFSDRDFTEMIVVKKIVGQYAVLGPYDYVNIVEAIVSVPQ